MTRLPPPLRFLAVAVGGWACLRAAMLAPDWWLERGEAAPAPDGVAVAPKPRPAAVQAAPNAGTRRPAATASTRMAALPAFLPAAEPARTRVGTTGSGGLESPAARFRARPFQPPAPPALVPPARTRRWSGSAWLLARAERGQPALAAGGTLGGSQAGARLLYRLNGDAVRPLSLSARLYVPLERRSGAEAAAGIDWRPFAGLPLNLLAERREALGRQGRSAFALTLYGGHSARLGRMRLDAYAQAGVVGLRSRDLFADGAVRLVAPIGGVEVGAAAWAAAQPGAERLDVGPQLSLPVPLPRTNLRLYADWRFRVAGEAAPDSGPAITLAADF